MHTAITFATADEPASGLRGAWNRLAAWLDRLLAHDLLALVNRLAIAALFFLSGTPRSRAG